MNGHETFTCWFSSYIPIPRVGERVMIDVQGDEVVCVVEAIEHQWVSRVLKKPNMIGRDDLDVDEIVDESTCFEVYLRTIST